MSSIKQTSLLISAVRAIFSVTRASTLKLTGFGFGLVSYADGFAITAWILLTLCLYAMYISSMSGVHRCTVEKLGTTILFFLAHSTKLLLVSYLVKIAQVLCGERATQLGNEDEAQRSDSKDHSSSSIAH